MINFSIISNNNIVGKLLRFPLRFIPKETVIPIIQGRLKGKKWIVGSSNHGCWVGSYEFQKQNLFAKIIKRGSVVYDIGAHVGFYTLLSSSLVGANGKVIAFEPLPRNIYYLKEHLQLNGCCENVKVIEAAVAGQSGIAFFEEGTNNYAGFISSKGCLEVKTISLDDFLLNSEIPPPDYMKIDVEGAEMLVLSGAEKILADYYPVIFLSTHGMDLHLQCCVFLKSLGYELKSINGKEIDKTDEMLAFKKN